VWWIFAFYQFYTSLFILQVYYLGSILGCLRLVLPQLEPLRITSHEKWFQYLPYWTLTYWPFLWEKKIAPHWLCCPPIAVVVSAWDNISKYVFAIL
jgi:hypothetical protein